MHKNPHSRHRALLFLPIVSMLFASSVNAKVFINEIHYDNAGDDTNEGIEIVATEGESLTGYKIYLYNGSTPAKATVYSTSSVPAGTQSACGSTVRFAHITYPTNTLQNGSNDGVAFVDATGKVLQFLSYEGKITASGGPAAGMTSTDIGVAETNSTAVGTSLQLKGSGSNFSWANSASHTVGKCNHAQSISGGTTPPPTDPAPTIISTSPSNNATSVPVAGDLSVVFSEEVTVSSGAFMLSCGATTIPLSFPSNGRNIAISTNTALSSGASCTFTIKGNLIKDSSSQLLGADRLINFTTATSTGNTGYYSRINTNSPAQLRCSLHATIKNHTSYPYSSSSGTNTWTILEIADEDPNNSSNILDIYRNRSYPKVSARAGTGSGLTYNREHTWPKSLGFSSTTGDKGLPNAPHTDIHMLYLSDTNFNSDRGNKPLDNCASGCGERVTEVNNGSGGGSGRYPGNSNWVNNSKFETWGKRKGDIARAVLYMAIRYEGGKHSTTGQSEPDLEVTDDLSKVVQTSASPAYMGKLSTLLQWHQADPPDANEKARNEVVFSFQGNRNPFIDHPEWATNALFTSSKPTSCQLIN